MIIIPARLKSTRFENKVLADILGLPMVIRTAYQVNKLDRVAIASDSQMVVDLAKEYGFLGVLTSSEHKSGTDRINEAATKLGLLEDEIVINVQADEPFIEPEVVQKVIERVQKAKKEQDPFIMVSCYKTIDEIEANDPNLVKVVVDAQKYALYFSRSKIPYNRDKAPITYRGHLGIYGFTRQSLREFCSLDVADLEDIEKLEQLRAIYHGKKIAMVEVKSRSFGIDTPQDLKRALEVFAK